MNKEQISAIKGLITTISILKWQRLTDEERNSCRENMDEHFERLDKLRVSFKIQNYALHLGEKYDIRLHYLDWYIVQLATACKVEVSAL